LVGRRVSAAFTVALVTVGLDYAFHALFTSPMEVPAYFAVKFIIAYVIADRFVGRVPTARAALYFSTAFTVLYYGIGVYLLNIAWLSVTTCSGGLPQPTCYNVITVFGQNNIYVLGAIEFVVHTVVFYIAAAARRGAFSRGRD
jgi:hypothetical protein